MVRACGLVAAGHDAVDPAIVHLMAMWVQPEARGAGGADALVAAVVAWAESERATTVRLDVVHGNLRARRFYERVGFTATGTENVRARDQVIEVQMEYAVALMEAE